MGNWTENMQSMGFKGASMVAKMKSNNSVNPFYPYILAYNSTRGAFHIGKPKCLGRRLQKESCDLLPIDTEKIGTSTEKG